jgi:hypothetical protein
MCRNITAFGFARPSAAAGFAVRASGVIEDRELEHQWGGWLEC